MRPLEKELAASPTDEQLDDLLSAYSLSQQVTDPSLTQLIFMTDVPDEFKDTCAPPKTHLAATPAGFSNQATAVHGVLLLGNHFKKVREEDGLDANERGLLIADNHAIHHTKFFKAACEAIKIDVVLLPKYSTHLIQPLDVSCMGPFKNYLRRLKPAMSTWVTQMKSIQSLKGRTR